MTRARGITLQAATAEYLRRWFPRARSTPNGQAGSDVQETAGFVWEVKTVRRVDLFAWAKQAARHAKEGDIPVLVYYPDGVGARRPERALACVPFEVFMTVCEAAGLTAQSVMAPAGTRQRKAAKPAGTPF